MNILARYPLRVSVPLLLLALTFLGAVLVFQVNSYFTDRRIETEAWYFLNVITQRNQARLTLALQMGDMERARFNIALLGEGGKDTALVVDDQQRVLSATNLAWEGLPMDQTSLPAEWAERLQVLYHDREKLDGIVTLLSDDRQSIFCGAPLRFGEEPPRTGLLVQVYDLHERKASAARELSRSLVLFGVLLVSCALLIWLYFHLIIDRRVDRIMSTMEQFGHGKHDARVALAGNDELAWIATVLDNMLDRKTAADRQLKEQFRLFQLLTDGLPVLVAYVDRELRYRLVNLEFEKWFYLTPQQIVGCQVEELMQNKAWTDIGTAVRKALDGEISEYEGAIPIVGDGMRQFRVTLLPHFENGTGVRGCFLLGQDISQHLRDMELLNHAKELWESTFNSIVDDLITIQDLEYRILDANQAALQFFDRTKEDIVGHTCYELFREEQTPCHGCPAFAAKLDGTAHCTEIFHQHSGRHFLVTMSPLRDGQGSLTGFVHSAKDITALRELEKQLRQAQKMEAIGTLAGGIAHDFNNILSPILGYTELVLERLPPGGEEHNLLSEVQNASRRAVDLVRQILTFSRQGEQERKPVRIHLIVKEALKLLRASIPSTITIKQNVEDCGLILADPTQIHQVLMNLCTNAYHAMRDKGGEMEVGLSVVDLSTTVEWDDLPLPPGRYVKLHVRDSGCGMTKDLQERIFEPYFTTKNKGEGTGLGLSVVLGIVQNHDGHITVDSEPGQGTEFQVYLPQIAQGVQQEDSESVPILRGHGTVLVVDDEATVRNLLQEQLSSLGYEVILCSSSPEALLTVQRQRNIDLVLSDMNMPIMHGAELARRIRKLLPDLPVVICSGTSLEREKAERLGIDAFLAKPVSKAQLGKVLHEVMGKRKIT